MLLNPYICSGVDHPRQFPWSFQCVDFEPHYFFETFQRARHTHTHTHSKQCTPTSGRFVEHEQRERWGTKQKLVYGSKHRGRFCGFRGGGISPRTQLTVYNAKSYNLLHFGRKIVRNAVSNAFWNTLTMGTPIPHVLLRNDSCPLHRPYSMIIR